MSLITIMVLDVFLFGVIGGFVSPALIKLKSTLPSDALGVLMMFPLFFQLGSSLWRKLLNEKYIIFGPIVLDIVLHIILVGLLYTEQIKLAMQLDIAVLSSVGVLFQIRGITILKILKNEVDIDMLNAKQMSAVALGTLTGLGIAALSSKVMSPTQTLLIGSVSNLLEMPLICIVSIRAYKKLKNQHQVLL